MWDDRQLTLISNRHEDRMVIMRLMAAFMKDADSFTPLSVHPKPMFLGSANQLAGS